MITLALFEKMAEDGVAGLTKNVDFFWEEMPLQKNGQPAKGVWIITRGGSVNNSPRGTNLRTIVDFYVAYGDKSKTEAIQMAIMNWLLANRGICDLEGAVGSASWHFDNIRIKPTTTPQNAGATENGLIVKTASAEIIYDLAES